MQGSRNMAQKSPNKHPVFFVMVFLLILLAVFVGYQALMTVQIPQLTSKSTPAGTKDIAPPTATRAPIPPLSQLTPTYDKVVKISITPNGFVPSTASMNVADLITFENTDLVKHTLTVADKSLVVLVDGMTAYRFEAPGTYTVKDAETNYTLSLTVR